MTTLVYVDRLAIGKDEPAVCVLRGDSAEHCRSASWEGPAVIKQDKRGLRRQGRIKVWIEVEGEVHS